MSQCLCFVVQLTWPLFLFFFFFFNDTAPTDIYTLSLHDALPILMEENGPEMVATDETMAVELPESFRDDPSLRDFKDVESLGRSYSQLRGMMGARIPLPNQESSPEEWQAFREKLADVPGVAMLPDPQDRQAMGEIYAKLGRPENPDGYQLPEAEAIRGYHPAVTRNFIEGSHEVRMDR